MTTKVDPTPLLWDGTEKAWLRLQSPPDYSAALGAEYELALQSLVPFLSTRRHHDLRQEDKQMTQRLTNHFLFNYYVGCAVARFEAPYRQSTARTFRQTALEDAVQKLATAEPARAVMQEWFAAALDDRIDLILRERLRGDVPLSSLRSALRNRSLLAVLPLVTRIEKLGRHDPHAINFGLAGYYLMFQRTRTISDCEFRTLLQYAKRMAAERIKYHMSELVDIVQILSIPCLLTSQRDALVSFTLSLCDLDQFPHFAPYEQIADPRKRVEAEIEAQNFGPVLSTIMKLLSSEAIKQAALCDVEDPEKQGTKHSIVRQQNVAVMLGQIAAQDAGILELAKEHSFFPFDEAKPGPRNVEELTPSALLIATLPGLIRNQCAMEAVSRRFATFPEAVLEFLRESSLQLEQEMVEFLLHLIREEGKETHGPAQLLAAIPSITYSAEQWITATLQTEENEQVVSALVGLHENLSQKQSVQDLEYALFTKIVQLLTADCEVEPRWVQWILGLDRQYIARALEILSSEIELQRIPSSLPHYKVICRLLADEVSNVPAPDPVVLAACWLIDPADDVFSDRPLHTRTEDAIELLQSADDDALMQRKVVDILSVFVPEQSPAVTDEEMHLVASQAGRWAYQCLAEHPILMPAFKQQLNCQLGGVSRRQKQPTWLAVTKALGRIHEPCLALPLLERLFDFGCELGEVSTTYRESYGQFYNDSLALVRQSLKSIVALRPLTPEAVELLKRAFSVSKNSQSILHTELTPSLVYDLLPLLVHETTPSPEAVSLLIDIVWNNHCALPVMHTPSGVQGDQVVAAMPHASVSMKAILGEKHHRYFRILHREGYARESLLLLCALQALATTADLTSAQQSVIWYVYRTSWHALTKGLCLLILSGQNPIQEKTIHELIRVLRQKPNLSVLETACGHALRRLLTSAPHSDIGYIYLCQTIAAMRAGSLLQQGTSERIPPAIQQLLLDALITNTSIMRFGMEKHVSDYALLDTYPYHCLGIIRALGSTWEAEIEADWIAHPAESAYEALRQYMSRQPTPSVFQVGKGLDQ